MLRVFLTVLVISMFAVVVPAFAQDCVQWCRANRCGGIYSGPIGPSCVKRCVAACHRKKTKPLAPRRRRISPPDQRERHGAARLGRGPFLSNPADRGQRGVMMPDFQEENWAQPTLTDSHRSAWNAVLCKRLS
jgi:hypothetical protein